MTLQEGLEFGGPRSQLNGSCGVSRTATPERAARRVVLESGQPKTVGEGNHQEQCQYKGID